MSAKPPRPAAEGAAVAAAQTLSFSQWSDYARKAMRKRDQTLTAPSTLELATLGMFAAVGDIADVARRIDYHDDWTLAFLGPVGDLLWHVALLDTVQEFGIREHFAPPLGTWELYRRSGDTARTAIFLARCCARAPSQFPYREVIGACHDLCGRPNPAHTIHDAMAANLKAIGAP